MQEGPDLFGQVPVTWPEVVEWVARVAGITPDSPRWLPYVRAWSGPDKIAAAKVREWQESTRPAVTPAGAKPPRTGIQVVKER